MIPCICYQRQILPQQLPLSMLPVPGNYTHKATCDLGGEKKLGAYHCMRHALGGDDGRQRETHAHVNFEQMELLLKKHS